MKALVTGGAGFIGSHLVDRLVAEGYRVTVLDDFSTGRRANLAQHLEGGPVNLYERSVEDPRVVEEAVKDCDLVFHLAARVGVKYYVENPLEVIRVNVRGTEAVLEAAYRRGVRVVLASTSEVYGKSKAMPLKEDGDRLLGSTTVDRWCYATSKALDEHLCFAYSRLGLPVVILRYFNIYGPRARGDAYGGVVSRFISQALGGSPLTVFGDGRQTRCFTYIDDAVEGTFRAALSPRATGQVINLGGGAEITINQLARQVRDLAGSPSPIVYRPYTHFYGVSYEDTRRRVPDVTRAYRLLGFRARIPLSEGLRRTLDWARKAGHRG